MRWFELTAGARNEPCASAECRSRPIAMLLSGGVGSLYCAECATRIERMRIESAETNREIDELERIFGSIEDR